MALRRKIAYIDLSTAGVKTAPIPIEMRKLFLGGRGLDTYLLYNHLEPGVDSLSPDNVLTVSVGLLTGTLASASARGHLGARSPLTGFIGSSNIGGFFAPELRWAGFDHLVIKGKADRPVYLWIHDGKIEICDAFHLWGEDIPTTQELIREELGDPEVQALCIGVAGENLEPQGHCCPWHHGRRNPLPRGGAGLPRRASRAHRLDQVRPDHAKVGHHVHIWFHQHRWSGSQPEFSA
jgi:aldehyde:ferredoxin oxidoreductase